MGIYLNPKNKIFGEAVRPKIYVDKTGMPAACYSRGCDSAELFRGLEIERGDSF